MARRRGFFAELQYQSRQAEQRRQAALRQQAAAQRRVEQAQRAAERAQLAAARASDAERKRLEREAAQAHAEAQLARVDELNEHLVEQYAELDGLLAATLAVDDFVDLESLRAVVQHPAFPREDLRAPLAPPPPLPDPPLPVKYDPAPVKGAFGRKKKEAAAAAAAEQQYATDYWAWQKAVQELPGRRAAMQAAFEQAETARQSQLAAELSRYQAECDEREKSATEQNAELDELINGLAYGTVDAVQEYVRIVLANSVYPDHFSVTHSEEFDPSTAELNLKVTIPAPDVIPIIKNYKYTKSTDEITTVELSHKDARDRYAAIVNNVALRSLHEVFEADRRGIIKSISLEVGTDTISPATGQPIYLAFAAVATTRDVFAELDLSAVVPAATLEHLGASVSKNPLDLVPISAAGVRRV